MPEPDDKPIAALLRHRAPEAGAITLDEIVRLRAQQHGERTVYKFLAEGESVTDEVTYADFDRRARAIGGWLQQNGYAGEPVLLIFPEGIDYVAAFFGCLYAGAIAVPINPPRRNRKSSRLETVAADCGARCVLTVGEALERAAEAIKESSLLGGLTWKPVEEIEPEQGDAWQLASPTEQTPALLQYTSGSTGTPKGVIVSHGNLVENQELITRAFGQDESVVLCGWLPIYHDMGLIGNVLHPAYLGGQHVFMPPMAFLQKPLRWLKMIAEHGGTLAGGPDFAFDLCVRETTPEERASLDLSKWQVAFNGSEPLRAKTLERFQEAFAVAKMGNLTPSPCYGMAETTLLVSGSRKTQPALLLDVDRESLQAGRVKPTDASDESQRLVGCGPPDQAVRLEIVDPETFAVMPEGEVGEVWISGKTVAGGYWKQPEKTEEIFQATIAGEPNVHFLRTGDLGVVLKGELFITGRSKDLIIVRGANHYPQDIEATGSAAHESLLAGSAAAFSVASGDGSTAPEQVVLVQEVQRSWLRKLPAEEVIEAVQRAVVDEHQVSLSRVVLIRTGQLPKTTSGKIQRSLCRQRLLAGELKIVADSDDFRGVTKTSTPRSAESSADCAAEVGRIQDWLVTQIAERTQLAIAQIDPNEPFARYGFDSLAAVRLSGKLSEWLGREVQPTIAYDYPTPATVAQFLATGEEVHVSSNVHRDPDEPLAIVGIGCRFPGSENPEAFWQLLKDKRSAIVDEPTDRWPSSNRSSDRPRRGGYLSAIDQFDPAFFGISPREAEQMDPQQRLLLEVAWETLENAGIAPDRYRGSLFGAFVGVSSGDYSRLQAEAGVQASAYTATGGSLAVLANRLSYTLDLRGPSLAIDTACSSSLVAVHQAAESLRRGDCDAALAGGVNLIVSGQPTQSLHDAGMLSPRGECSSFTRAADGFVRGEGCGLVLLKRLSQAVADGDRIYSVLRGTAINQDGRSNGLTAPNGPSQRAVIRRALDASGLEPNDIDYLEAHGTGTELGDPTEMGSLIAVFARDRKQPLQIGSAKANIGHLEGAAGIAGFIKTCLSLHYGRLLPQPAFDPNSSGLDGPSKHIDWSQSICVPHEVADWSHDEKRVRRAGVSSFGFGGTNAHVVVEEAPKIDHEGLKGHEEYSSSNARWVTLSAKSRVALENLAQRYVDELDEGPIEQIAYAANVGQASHLFRLAIEAKSAAQLKERLAHWVATGTVSDSILYAEVSPNSTATALESQAESRDKLAVAIRQWIAGQAVDFKGCHSKQILAVTLPSYPWQRQRYWFATPKPKQKVAQGDRVHPLLGVKLDLAGELATFEADLTEHAWLNDHRLRGEPTLPAVAYVELAMAAANDLQDKTHWQVADLELKQPLSWFEGAEVCRVQTQLVRTGEGGYSVSVQQRTEEGWQLAAECQLQPCDPSIELARVDCSRLTDRDVSQHFTRCEAAGLGYGPTFQGIKSLAGEVGTATATIELPAVVEVDGYSLHPTAADAALQALSAALPPGWQDGWVPKGIGRATLVSDSPQPRKFLAVVAIETPLADEPPAEIVANVTITSETGEPIARFEQVRLARVTATQVSRFFQEVWEPQLREREASLPPVVNASELASRVSQQSAQIAKETGATGHLKLLERLEQRSADYVVQAMRELDTSDLFRPGASFTMDQALQTLGVTAEKQRLFERLLQMLDEAGHLRKEGSKWHVAESLPTGKPMAEETPSSPEMALLQRCGDQLAGVLQGKVDPLPILFPSDDAAGGTAADVYRFSAGAMALNRLTAEAIAETIAELPVGRGLRVLELGAGTGATTERVLARNDIERMRYRFTDVAAGFVAAAKQRLPQHDNLMFETLDIERDPVSQGFEAESFDVIIAANVLHATADIAQTLENARKLLTPGGQLLLVEGTRTVRWLDLTFGLTDGWWRFSDTDLRPDYALLCTSAWRGVLQRCGFATMESVEIVPPVDGVSAENSLLIATADSAKSTHPTAKSDQPTSLIAAWSQPEADALAACMREAGQRVDTQLVTEISGNVLLAPHVIALAPQETEHADPNQAEQLTRELLTLLQAVERASADGAEPQRITLVTRSQTAEHTAMVGLMRAAIRELPSVRVRVVEAPQGELSQLAPAIAEEIAYVSPESSTEPEVQLRADGRFVRRLVDASPAFDPQRSRELMIQERGTLSGAVLETKLRLMPGASEVQIRIAAAGLNFRDLLNVLGKYPGTPPLGAECAGVVESVGEGVTDFIIGDRVIAVTPRTFADFVNVSDEAVLKIDDSLSLQDAATLPVAYGTASVALEELGKVKAGTRVLIHAATGGVGTAALEIAAEQGCEVYATASHNKQWLLRRRGLEYIYDSRSELFAVGVLQDSAGKGAEVLVNALPDEFVEANLQALGEGGIYVDLTKPAMDVAAQIKSSRPDVRYHLVDLASDWEADPARIRRLLEPILQRVSGGQLKPLPVSRNPLSEATAALRRLQSSTHVGKVLLCQEPNTETQRAAIRSDGTYLIAGGYGDLGLLTAEWLSSQGAGCVALIGRREPAEEPAGRIDQITATGTKVIRLKANLAERGELESAIAELRKAGLPLRGVIHAAGALDDGMLASQSAEKIANVFAAKVHGAWNLHSLTAGDPLDFFTVYSSIASVLGAPGQSNHSAANAYLDGLMTGRRSQGLPARSINWGPWRDVGEAARRGVDARRDLAGIDMLNPELGKQAIAELAGTSGAAVTVAPWNLAALPERLRQAPLLTRLVQSGASRSSHDNGELRGQLDAAPAFQHHQILVDYLREQLAGVLGIQDPQQISPTTAMFDMGLDSLTTLELKNTLGHSTGLELPANLMFDFPTIDGLSTELAKRLVEQSEQETPSVSQAGQDAQHRESDALKGGGESSSSETVKHTGTVAAEPSVWDDLASLEQELEAWEGSR